MLELILEVVGLLIIAIGALIAASQIIERMSSGSHSDNSGRDRVIKIGVFVAIIGIFVFALPSFFVEVDAGNVGIQKTFGVVDSKVLPPGLSIKNPFTEVIPMSTRTQKYMDYGSSDVATITALSNDGLETKMGIAVNYHLNPDKAAALYMQVGTDYSGIAMVNPIHSVPRDMISKYDTKTLYSASLEGSTDRAMLEHELTSSIISRMNEVGVKDSIIIEQVSIRNIDFVQTYKDSIAAKMKMDTEIQQKKLEVEKQKMEAERVGAQAEGEANKARIDAQGRADAQRIDAQGTKDAMNTIGADQYKAILFIQTMKDNPRAIYLPSDGSVPVFKNVDATG